MIMKLVKEDSPETQVISPLRQLRGHLVKAFVEREEAIDATIIAILARENVYYHGKPGTGKSALIRVLAHAFMRKYWEVLMTRFSTPEEIFGPVKPSGFMLDKFERAIDNYLAGCEIGFIDECWKANSAILNALLTIMNERLFHNNGIPVPVFVISIIGASNELPEGPELGALWDRFMIRLNVDYIADDSNFVAMLQGGNPSIPSVNLDLAHEQALVSQVTIDPSVYTVMCEMKRALKKAGLEYSDRRWNKIQGLLKAAAHYDGRVIAMPEDLAILEHVLWNEPSEKSNITRIVQAVINPNAAIAVECLDSAKDLRSRASENSTVTEFREINLAMTEILTKLSGLGSGKVIDNAVKQVTVLRKQVITLANKQMGLES